MARVLKAVDAISDWSGKVLGFLIYPGTAVLVYEVVSRYFFASPTVWAHGTSQRMFGAYFIVGAAYCLFNKSHIRVDIIYTRFSLRTQAIVDAVITFPFLFLVVAVLLWQGSEFFWVSALQLEFCETPFHAPVYPLKFFLPFTGLLLLLQGLADFCRCLVTIVTGVASK